MNNEDVKDVLGRFLQEHYSQLRHYETQRSTVSNLLVIIAAAILAFVTYDKALTWADLPLTILLCIMGLFGAAFCAKYYERSAMYYDRIKQCRDKLDEVLFESKLLNNLRDEANRQHAEEFPRFQGGKLEAVS